MVKVRRSPKDGQHSGNELSHSFDFFNTLADLVLWGSIVVNALNQGDVDTRSIAEFPDGSLLTESAWKFRAFSSRCAKFLVPKMNSRRWDLHVSQRLERELRTFEFLQQKIIVAAQE